MNHNNTGVSMQKFLCPVCGSVLKQVVYKPWSVFNESQFLEKRAGDFYCSACPSNNRGNSNYCYWWEHELNEIKHKKMLEKLKDGLYEMYYEDNNIEEIQLSAAHYLDVYSHEVSKDDVFNYFQISIKNDISEFIGKAFAKGILQYTKDIFYDGLSAEESSFLENDLQIQQILMDFFLHATETLVKSLTEVECFKMRI